MKGKRGGMVGVKKNKSDREKRQQWVAVGDVESQLERKKQGEQGRRCGLREGESQRGRL